MVKVHKPIPKPIKNDDPGLKKVQSKIIKANSKTEVAKKVKKVMAIADTNKADNIINDVVLNNKKHEPLEKMNETVLKKKPFVQKSAQNGEIKKSPSFQEVPKAAGKAGLKKKKAVVKSKQSDQNSSLEETETVQQSAAKKPKMQQTAKKLIANKKLALTEESLMDSNDFSKQITTKQQKTAKKHAAKKNFALEEEAEENKKVHSKNKHVAAEVQDTIESKVLQTVKKPVANKMSTSEEKSGNDKKELPKKKKVATKQQPISKKTVGKESSAVKEEPEKDTKGLSKIKQFAAKQLSTAKMPAAKSNLALEEESGKVKKDLSNKKLVVAKQKLTAKKPAAKKSPALEEQSEKDKKDVAKKNQISAKQQPATKKPVAKKNTTAEANLEKDIKEAVKKADLKKPVKKAVAKKNVAAGKVSETVKTIGQMQNGTVEKSDKKSLSVINLNSKVQKKASAGKKNENNLKKKVKTLPQTDKDEILKSKKEESPVFDPEDFDESKFKNIVSLHNIKEIGKALNDLVKKEVSKRKTAIFTDYSYFLNVACYKIGNCPKRMVKLNLKHSLVDTNLDDVVLIVPDLKRGAKVDYEPTIQHYEDILRECGIGNIKVLPFNQLRNEYSSYEAKRKLSNTYDYYLCDGRIVGHVFGFCGKNFQKPRTTIHAVDLNNPKTIKKEIEHGLKRTAFRQLQKGDLTSVLVGSHRHSTDQLAENIEKVIEQLKTVFPGGYANIRSMYLKIDIKGTSALPIYLSLSGAPDEVPNVIGPREQKMLKLKKQANDILSNFSLSKSGDIVKLTKTEVKRKKEINEARKALTSKNTEAAEEASELNPPLKKKSKKAVEPQTSNDGEVSNDDKENGEASNDGIADDNSQMCDEESEQDDEDDDGACDEDSEGEDSDDDEGGEDDEDDGECVEDSEDDECDEDEDEEDDDDGDDGEDGDEDSDDAEDTDVDEESEDSDE